MPRSKDDGYELTLNGRVVSRGDFMTEIGRFVAERVQAKPLEIAELLGPEWLADHDRKHYVATTMVNMANQGWLMRVRHGVYSLHPHYETRKARRLEDQIIDTIRSLGGVARARDILEDFGARPAADKQRSFGGRSNGAAGRIFKLMKESSRIVHYNLPKRPRWGLPWNEMAKEPLTGTVAAYLMEMGFLAAIERGEMEGGPRWQSSLQDEIKEHFNMVGLTFRRARLLFNVEAEDLLADPTLVECLECIKQSHPALTARIHADIKNDTQRRAAEESRADDLNYIEAMRDKETDNFLAHVLTYFEMGDPAAHQVAPPQFYRAFAARFNMDAAALSRGSLIPTPRASDLTDEWWYGDEAAKEFGEPLARGAA